MLALILLAQTSTVTKPIIATPVPITHTQHVAAVLRPGDTAEISDQGNGIPCWNSPEALTSFLQARANNDQTGVEMQVAYNSVLLESGQKVKALAFTGLLGQVTQLKLVDGDNAGHTCYEPSSMNVYTAIKRKK